MAETSEAQHHLLPSPLRAKAQGEQEEEGIFDEPIS